MTANEKAYEKAIGQRVRLARERANITSALLAKRIGVNEAQLKKHEQGVLRISVGRLYRISEALGVSPGWFFIDLPDSGFHWTERVSRNPGERQLYLFALSNEGCELIRAYLAISNTRERERLLRLTQSISTSNITVM